jgi:NitT/TauT family transport system ATP-binding protein
VSRDAAKIQIAHLSVMYQQLHGQLWAIEDLSLDIYEREFLCIVGASGCGKTTLLNVVAGLIPPSSGEVRMDGQPIRAPGPERAMVFQEDAVFPWYTVRQNLEYGLKIANVPQPQRVETVDRYLRLVGLDASQHAYPRELSGGMRKRVDVARAMTLDPQVLLMDEPFAALDVLTKERLQVEFLKLWSAARMTVLFVTHDLEEALFLADRVVVMSTRAGRIREVVSVPFGRPRAVELKTKPEFQDLRRELARELEESPAMRSGIEGGSPDGEGV